MLTIPLNPILGGWATISPGGQTIALSARDGQARGVDIWLHDLSHGATSRFTFGPGSHQAKGSGASVARGGSDFHIRRRVGPRRNGYGTEVFESSGRT